MLINYFKCNIIHLIVCKNIITQTEENPRFAASSNAVAKEWVASQLSKKDTLPTKSVAPETMHPSNKDSKATQEAKQLLAKIQRDRTEPFLAVLLHVLMIH